MIRLLWHDSKNLDSIPYENGYFNEMFIDTELTNPTYVQETESEQMDNGTEVDLFSKIVKMFSCEFFALEYQTDALSMLGLHSVKKVEYLGETYDMNDVEFEVEWPVTNIALCKLRFSVDFVIKKACSGEVVVVLPTEAVARTADSYINKSFDTGAVVLGYDTLENGYYRNAKVEKYLGSWIDQYQQGIVGGYEIKDGDAVAINSWTLVRSGDIYTVSGILPTDYFYSILLDDSEVVRGGKEIKSGVEVTVSEPATMKIQTFRHGEVLSEYSAAVEPELT